MPALVLAQHGSYTTLASVHRYARPMASEPGWHVAMLATIEMWYPLFGRPRASTGLT